MFHGGQLHFDCVSGFSEIIIMICLSDCQLSVVSSSYLALYSARSSIYVSWWSIAL